LFYSNREAKDAAFLEEFENMAARNRKFTLIPTATGHRTLAWPYEKGHISREMLTRYLFGLRRPIYYIAGPSGLKEPIYYIAGPSGMVTAMTDLLHSSGVGEDDVKTEEFGDYKLPQDPAPNDPGTGIHRSDSAL
jgi:ferredoxin-NADP reductase